MLDILDICSSEVNGLYECEVEVRIEDVGDDGDCGVEPIDDDVDSDEDNGETMRVSSYLYIQPWSILKGFD
jgi:hypothetical protein